MPGYRPSRLGAPLATLAGFSVALPAFAAGVQMLWIYIDPSLQLVENLAAAASTARTRVLGAPQRRRLAPTKLLASLRSLGLR